MAVEQFVDVIKQFISLNVLRAGTPPAIDYISSTATLISSTSPYTYAYVYNPLLASTYPNVSSLFVDFEHDYSGYNSQNYTGSPNVTNIVSLNVLDAAYSTPTLNSYIASTGSLFVERSLLPSSYIEGNSYNYTSNSFSTYIDSDQDEVELLWTSNTDTISQNYITFEEAFQNGGPSQGSGDQSTIKEFWA